jgi:ferrous iron transport protein A
METTLKDLGVGESACVIGYGEGGRAYRAKLLAFGLTPGAELRVQRVAPLGDPLEIRVRGSSVSLRKVEAETLWVERLDFDARSAQRTGTGGAA